MQTESNNNESSNTTTNSSSNDVFLYLAAESSAGMSEWINQFNFVSKLKYVISKWGK